ncbi:MAG: peptidoglycan-associated lipoprotein Pal [Candidatus Symbiodolus clandestinus]
MALNPSLKAVLLALPLVVATSCSKKSAECKDELSTSAEEVVTAVEVPVVEESQLYADEQAHQLEELKKSNIIFFGFDKYDIRKEFAQNLDEHATFLQNNPNYRVLIEGHTDERGTPEYNIALGERRANAVAKYLQSQGVSEGQITIVSYGQERPEDPGHSETAYAKNRRVVLVY